MATMAETQTLEEIARALVAPGKGILAADESDGTIKKRFDSIGVESTEENRRAYRDLLFTTEGAEEFISGVILFDETIRQSSADGTPFPKLLESRGIIPGIKVDKGAKPLARRRGRDGHRGPGRAAGAPPGVLRARRAVHEVARGHLHRPGDPERLLHLDERARPGAVRRPLAGVRPRPDRRARGADGRHALDRGLLPRHRPHAPGALHRALRPASRARGDTSEDEHGRVRIRRLRTGGHGHGRRDDDQVPEEHVPRLGTRCRLPLRRNVGRGRHCAPERHEPAGAAPVGALLLVRARAAGAGA